MAQEKILQAIKAVVSSSATREQEQFVLSEISSGKVSISRGERSVAAGDIVASNIVTGDGNVLCQLSVDEEYVLKALLQEFHPSSPYQLPNDLVDFTGRETEVEELLAQLRQSSGVVAISALNGLGGIGKSALAVHVAHRLASDYPAGQLFIELRGLSGAPLTPLDAMAHVIRTFHPAAQMPESEDALLPLYRNVLSTQKVLLVFDNARNAAQVRLLLPPIPSAAIITSRQPIMLENVAPHRLDLMSPEEARLLLRETTGPDRLSDDELSQISKACGHLPLALRVAGTFLNLHPDWTTTEYLAELADEKTRLKALTVPDHNLDVAATLALSVDQLNKENPSLVSKWRQLSVFVGGFDRTAVSNIWECKGVSARDGLGVLLRRTLVQYDEETGRYQLHDLMRDVALLERDEGLLFEDASRHAVHYLGVLSKASDRFHDGGDGIENGLALWDMEEANILAGHKWAVNQLEQSETETSARLCFEYASTASLIHFRLHPRTQLEWHDAALKAARLFGFQQGEGGALGNMGNALYSLGRYPEAVKCQEESLIIARKTGNRPSEANALGNLGRAYNRCGDYSSAIKFLQQDIAIEQELGNKRAEGIALNNLGVAYKDFGDPRKAIECHEKSLAIALETGNLIGEGNAWGDMGNAYKRLEDYPKAIECFEKHLQTSLKIGDLHGEGTALGNLGTVYDHMGVYPKAITFFKQHEEIASKIGDRLGEGNALGNQGGAFIRLGDYPRAIRCCEKSLEIDREIGNRPGAGNALINLCVAYLEAGNYPKAILYGEQSLEFSRTHGFETVERNALCNLGCAYLRLGEYPEAIKYCEQHLSKASGADGRKGVGVTLGNLGTAYFHLGNFEKAKTYHEQSLAIAREIGDRLSEGNALLNMGCVSERTGDAALGIEHAKAALEIYQEIGSPTLEKALGAIREWSNTKER